MQRRPACHLCNGDGSRFQERSRACCLQEGRREQGHKPEIERFHEQAACADSQQQHQCTTEKESGSLGVPSDAHLTRARHKNTNTVPAVQARPDLRECAPVPTQARWARRSAAGVLTVEGAVRRWLLEEETMRRRFLPLF